ncbi:MAG: zf-HC2 domain-containing protein [Chthonomonadales bacterium]|nr:zf-HC2 domain-containing protein [Chthonomonadales bacterium]
MTTCSDMLRAINDFIDGALPAETAVAVADHLRECRACRREHAALAATRRLLGNVPAPEAGPSRERVLARFRAGAGTEAGARSARPRPPALRRRLGWATAAALAVLGGAVAIGPGLLAPGRSSGVSGGLPAVREIDEMVALHAAQALAEAGPSAEFQRDAHAEATARLQAPEDFDAL